ncbi:23S rRNA (guanosine(2251)-2'-O)-methyltransferase RlmB [Anoxybacter fermentans]|uniref:23S rRNA (Guanosine(2251)-2'-O)-methyltransferase RlmB n=1 Tax=Anoxybacter fermentans TaxID=1323375 RepID=A0A3Q9HUK2_9FIRM|nr:23S rRNA (guanosine(2251)-2'-O)-methyltransferase RlmB [Anoxybacter fermentans]AZR74701.1 23S rRNA (guanosine(2251)-2'-O)-methyltransferase RlmB [Anoxybacter fermentans]
MRKIEGRNPVLEAMNAGREIKKLIIQKGARGRSIQELIERADKLNIPVEMAAKSELDRIATSSNHQGVVAYADEFRYVHIDEILQFAEDKGESPLIVILDRIQDPHNLGSIIRTANAAGVHGVIIPKHRASGITPVVTKTSAGAVEYTKVARVTNIARAIDELKEAGLWIVGSGLEGDRSIYQADLKGPLGIVIGSEGEGMRRLVKEKCDFIVQIPMFGQIESLNASVAAGIMIYEAVRQRRFS